MANFRTHISFGIAKGILSVFGLASLVIVKAPVILISVLVLVILGSVLPDMDSDSSIPFHVAFGSLTMVAAVLAFLSVYNNNPDDWKMMLMVSGGVAFFLWGVVGFIFKKFTHHRGMAHSLPAAFLSALITFFVANRFNFSDQHAFLLGIAIMLGYVGHLLLDEIYAGVNFHGKLFVPNKAFGSALKIKSDSKLINFAVYCLIIFLMLGNVERFKDLTVAFFKSLGF